MTRLVMSFEEVEEPDWSTMTLVVSVDDMTDEMFLMHLKLRHPGRGAVLAPPNDRDGHDEMHDWAPHAHYHDYARGDHKR